MHGKDRICDLSSSSSSSCSDNKVTVKTGKYSYKPKVPKVTVCETTKCVTKPKCNDYCPETYDACGTNGCNWIAWIIGFIILWFIIAIILWFIQPAICFNKKKKGKDDSCLDRCDDKCFDKCDVNWCYLLGISFILTLIIIIIIAVVCSCRQGGNKGGFIL